MQIDASSAGALPVPKSLRLALAAAPLALLALAPPALAADAPTPCAPGHPRINVMVEALRSGAGDVVVELYPDDAKRFLVKTGRLSRTRVKAERGMTVCIPAPAAGGYAVAVYHDENGDHHFNKNTLGLPTEGFGVSNNPSTLLGKPSFQSVRFMAGEGDTTIHVRMRYLLGGGGAK